MLSQQIRTTRTQGITQCERRDQHIVELTRNWDEVGNEVNRCREVGDEEEKNHLAPSRNAWVAKQAPEEDQTVWDEAGKGPRLCSPASEIEKDDEYEVEGENNPAQKKGRVSALHAQRGLGDPAGGLPGSLRGPRSRRAVGVGNVAGERGDRAAGSPGAAPLESALPPLWGWV